MYKTMKYATFRYDTIEVENGLNTFDKHGSTEIGRWLSRSVGFPPLKSGDTRAIFQDDGNVPRLNDSLNRYAILGEIWPATSLMALAGISSTPVVFVVFIEIKALYTSSFDMCLKLKESKLC